MFSKIFIQQRFVANKLFVYHMYVCMYALLMRLLKQLLVFGIAIDVLKIAAIKCEAHKQYSAKNSRKK